MDRLFCVAANENCIFGVSFVGTLFYFGRGVIFYNKVLFFITELKLDYEWSNMNLSIVRR